MKPAETFRREKYGKLSSKSGRGSPWKQWREKKKVLKRAEKRSDKAATKIKIKKLIEEEYG